MAISPRTLDELKAITDPAERAKAVPAYIATAEEAIGKARGVRRDAIVEVHRACNNVARTARDTGVSESTVRSAISAG